MANVIFDFHVGCQNPSPVHSPEINAFHFYKSFIKTVTDLQNQVLFGELTQTNPNPKTKTYLFFLPLPHFFSHFNHSIIAKVRISKASRFDVLDWSWDCSAPAHMSFSHEVFQVKASSWLLNCFHNVEKIHATYMRDISVFLHVNWMHMNTNAQTQVVLFKKLFLPAAQAHMRANKREVFRRCWYCFE